MTSEVEIFREPVDDAGDRPGPRIIVVGGAKGGVGKSMFAANLGVYLATLGRRAIIADADAGGADLHSFLGATHPCGIPTTHPFLANPDEPGVRADARSDVSALGLRLLHCGIDEPTRGETRRSRRGKLMNKLRALDADYVVLDVGSGTHRSILDLWLDADTAVFLTLPEPTATEGTYRFVRAAFARRLLRAADGPAERRRWVALLREHGNAPPPLDLVRALVASHDPFAEKAERELASFTFHFAVNQTRLRADLELGTQIESAARRRLGVRMDYLGHIDTDDTVWNALRLGRPLLVESPGTKASRNLEKIARRLLAISAGKHRSRQFPNVPLESHHDLLEVERGATEEEVRRAYKRAKELYANGSLACYGLFGSDTLTRVQSRVEEAHDVLLDPARRRPYELGVFSSSLASDSQPPAEQERGATSALPPITPDTEFTGSFLRAVRESHGISLREVAQRTKIGVAFLQGIEEETFGELPAPVYVRGFVVEMAKLYGVDVTQVAATYMKRQARWEATKENLAEAKR